MTENRYSRKSVDYKNWADQILCAAREGRILQYWDELEPKIQLQNCEPTQSACLALLEVADAIRLDGGYSRAIPIAERALELAYSLHAESIVARIQAVFAAIYMHQGDMHKARLATLDSLAAARREKSSEGICRSLLWLAYVEQSSGNLGGALQCAKDCLRVSTDSNLPLWKRAAHRSIGLVSSLQGALTRAIESLSESISIARRQDRLDDARTLLSLSHAQTLAGRLLDAEASLRAAYLELETCNSIRDLAIYYEYSAALYLNQGKLDDAESAIKECVRISLEEFPDGDMTSQGYRLWAEIDVRRGDFRQAREHANDALGVARRVGEKIEIGAIERILGQCDDADGQAESAARHFADAIGTLSECGARYELALCHLAAGQASCHDRAARLNHLHTALALFGDIEVERFAQETEDAIRGLTSPSRPQHDSGQSRTRIITRTKAMRDVIKSLDRVKNYDDIILLEGETGVGKDLLARYAHDTSGRADRPFVLFNAAAVPEALAESELFGHVRGSFSGAMRDREGLLFAAKNGTFFFNEISEAPPTFQAKLLSVIETRRARPIGSNVEKPIEARFIFATNRNLENEVKAGSFRKDLFYRLTTARFVIPPVRDRVRDIEPLLTFFLQRLGMDAAGLAEIATAPEWSSLTELPWEGNVRELEMFSRRLAREIAHDSHLPPSQVLRHLLTSALGLGNVSQESIDRLRIVAALKKHGGNKRRAAADLGLPESTLRWRIKHLGIEFRA